MQRLRSATLALGVLALVGCGQSAGTSDAGDAAPPIDADAIGPMLVVCNGSGPHSFPTFDRTCTVDSDCTVGAHTVNCCGTVQLVGFRTSESAGFAAAEAACDAMYPGCGCASDGVIAENGVNVGLGSGDRSGVARCVAGMCRALSPAIPCGAAMCDIGQVCVQDCVGVDGGVAPAPRCVAVPDACTPGVTNGCNCLGAAGCAAGSVCPDSLSEHVLACRCG